ncbi:hypothetical protein FB45DRAFT_1139665 [Roridomyces roridus]|uniref:F-box domain-containing protein n=1 Tax=Roridomyces roridus TaxID=1738132 RepID=A0AAD7FU15_9AGAR|nr:hypothetical protein FB45DRAFT_1139665 [Roridomyces roridus]
MKTFPPELVDITLDFLFDDVLTLIRSSQVCKAWKTERLVRLLSHPLSTLAPAIRRVCVGSIAQQADLMALMKQISPCAPVLRFSRSLYLRAITWKDIDDTCRDMFVSKFGSVTELVLSNIQFGAFDDLAGLLASFPALQRLYFVRVQWLHGPQRDSMKLLNLPNLKTLEIDYGCQDVVEWLHHCSPEFPSLSTFHLKLSEIRPTLDKFIPDFTPCLEHVELAFYRLYPESLHHFTVDLSQNTVLRSVHLSHLQLNELGLSGADPSTNSIYVGWVPKVLSSVRAPAAVEKLRFSVWVTAVSDIDLLDWDSLKRIFLPSTSGLNPYASLNSFVLDLYGKMYDKADRETVERRIHAALQECRAEKCLKFRWH